MAESLSPQGPVTSALCLSCRDKLGRVKKKPVQYIDVCSTGTPISPAMRSRQCGTLTRTHSDQQGLATPVLAALSLASQRAHPASKQQRSRSRPPPPPPPPPTPPPPAIHRFRRERCERALPLSTRGCGDAGGCGQRRVNREPLPVGHARRASILRLLRRRVHSLTLRDSFRCCGGRHGSALPSHLLADHHPAIPDHDGRHDA